MDDKSIQEITAEFRPLLVGRSPGKIFQIDAQTVVIDFRLREHRALLISVNPSQPRIHLINCRLRELERQSISPGQFALILRKQLSNSKLVSITKDPADRIIRLEFVREADARDRLRMELTVQLTGRSANLFLLNETNIIVCRLRSTGPHVGEPYRFPGSHEQKKAKQSTSLLRLIESGRFTSASDAADSYYQALDREREFRTKIAAAGGRLKSELSRKRKLLQKLHADLASHHGAEQHKRIGDLLLANVSTARRSGNRVALIDYFQSNAPTIEVEMDKRVSLPEEASRRFALYSRSKRALGQITARIEKVNADIASLASKQQELDRIIAARDESALAQWSVSSAVAGGGARAADRSEPRASARGFKRVPGTRRYISSEGFEILVGRAAKDNDYLTFKVAKPNDFWLHSADYPGSHVIVRNPTRKEIPHGTIIEAAELAAYFSQANKNPKVDVHYTQRKFLSKPKRAAPGLVRMLRFKTITVEPKINASQS